MTSFLNKLKASLAAPALPQLHREQQPLLNPLDIPAIIGRAPADFAFYEFDGATLVTIRKKNAAGQIVRRRGLVACMVLNDQTSDGASAQIEMLVSLTDLRNGNHPHHQKAEQVLMDLHTTKHHRPLQASKTIVSRAAAIHEDFMQASREKFSFLLGVH